MQYDEDQRNGVANDDQGNSIDVKNAVDQGGSEVLHHRVLLQGPAFVLLVLEHNSLECSGKN